MSAIVSVIVPTCGRASMIRRAIESIITQSYPHVELIVVNDNVPGSADSLDTLAELARYGDQLRIISTPGRIGGGAARNLGCAQARGSYLAFLDDDDVFLEDKIAHQVNFMIENELEMSYQDVAWFTENGKLTELRALNHASGYSRQELLRAHLRVPIAPTSIYMMRADAFERTSGFGNTKTGQDWHLMLSCIQAGLRIGYMPGVYVRQILHSEGRLSLGMNKVQGELERHGIVRSFYSILTKREIRFIEFRHSAVLAVSSYRSGLPKQCLGHLVNAFLKSPADFMVEGWKHSKMRLIGRPANDTSVHL